jgi:hypothetical protein
MSLTVKKVEVSADRNLKREIMAPSSSGAASQPFNVSIGIMGHVDSGKTSLGSGYLSDSCRLRSNSCFRL